MSAVPGTTGTRLPPSSARERHRRPGEICLGLHKSDIVMATLLAFPCSFLLRYVLIPWYKRGSFTEAILASRESIGRAFSAVAEPAMPVIQEVLDSHIRPTVQSAQESVSMAIIYHPYLFIGGLLLSVALCVIGEQILAQRNAERNAMARELEGVSRGDFFRFLKEMEKYESDRASGVKDAPLPTLRRTAPKDGDVLRPSGDSEGSEAEAEAEAAAAAAAEADERDGAEPKQPVFVKRLRRRRPKESETGASPSNPASSPSSSKSEGEKRA